MDTGTASGCFVELADTDRATWFFTGSTGGGGRKESSDGPEASGVAVTASDRTKSPTMSTRTIGTASSYGKPRSGTDSGPGLAVSGGGGHGSGAGGGTGVGRSGPVLRRAGIASGSRPDA
jgi:hypothetical protein